MSEDKMSDVENYLRHNARIIDRKLTQFSQSAQLLSSETPRMIDRYDNQWVGVYHGQVAASGATLEAVTAEIEKKGIPAGETIVRHIDRESRTFIFKPMLRGRFGDTSRRPYLEANLIIPSLQIEGMISFCVDTGADSTVLMPTDAAILQIDYGKLTTRSQCVGVGGVSDNYLVPAVLVVTDHDTALYAYHINLTVIEPSPEMMGAPSLLGRDVLNRWCLTMDYHHSLLTAEIRSSDIQVPLRSA